MKTTAIVKICICAVVAALLIGALVFLLRGDFLQDGEINLQFFGFGNESYTNAKDYTVGDGSVSDGVSRLQIHWASGKVSVSTYDGDEIVFRESGYGKDSERMCYLLQSGTLTLRYKQSGFYWGSFPKKTLEVLIPEKELGYLSISVASADTTLSGISASSFNFDTASGDLDVRDCSFDSVDIDCASGECSLAACKIGSFEMDTASGSARINGSVDRIDFDGASADLTVVTDVTPQSIETDTASGRVELVLPADAEFRAEMDALSGKLRVEDFVGRYDDDEFICGSGWADYSFDAASGDVLIRAGK